jgi:PKD repeat protein
MIGLYLRSVLLLMAFSTLLFGGSGSWKAIVCDYIGDNVTPFSLPLGGTPVPGTPLTLSFPWSVAITPNATTAVVSDDNLIHEVDLTSETLREITHLAEAGLGYGLAITPDGTKAYICMAGNGIIVIRLSDFTYLTTITSADLGGDPFYVAISPTRSEAYVSSEANRVFVINTETDTVDGPPIAVTGLTDLMSVTPDGSEVYVSTSAGFSYITVADRLSHTIPGITNACAGNAITPNGAIVFVLSNNDDSVYLTRIDPHTHTILQTEALSPELITRGGFIAITPDGKTACITGEFLSEQVNPHGALPAATPGGVVIFMDISGSGAPPVAFFPGGLSKNGVAITPDQAPIARFTFTSTALTVLFDASTSDSPVGTVVRYDWDFGDGQTQTTTSPSVSHTYNSLGTYTVTLTVTNTAGTSTEITFTGQTVSNNGGPSARHNETISVVAQAPRHFRGKAVIHHKEKTIRLHTKWKYGSAANVRRYEIFARNKLIEKISVFHKPRKTIRLHAHHIPGCISKKYRRYLHHKYQIRTVDMNGNASRFIKLKVKHHH